MTFGYDENRPVLSGLSAEFAAGGCYAVVGASGSGKSTLLSLLMGAHSNYGGQIAFDGCKLRDASLESLWATVSLVRQDTFLFNATLRENVTMFAHVDTAELESAVRRAGLASIVAAHGMDYPCGEGGSNLSGGERQRVCIARSLLHGAGVLLLDEATSALDQETADQVTRAVVALEGTTRIMVTHRLDAGQLRLFDGIVVLRDGPRMRAGHLRRAHGRAGRLLPGALYGGGVGRRGPCRLSGATAGVPGRLPQPALPAVFRCFSLHERCNVEYWPRSACMLGPMPPTASIWGNACYGFG